MILMMLIKIVSHMNGDVRGIFYCWAFVFTVDVLTVPVVWSFLPLDMGLKILTIYQLLCCILPLGLAAMQFVDNYDPWTMRSEYIEI